MTFCLSLKYFIAKCRIKTICLLLQCPNATCISTSYGSQAVLDSKGRKEGKKSEQQKGRRGQSEKMGNEINTRMEERTICWPSVLI
jgi:hypothetical protein